MSEENVMKKIEIEQTGDYSVQVVENHGNIHIHQNPTDDIERLESKFDKMQETLNILLSIVINAKDKSLVKYVNENLPQFDTITLDSYNGDNTTHVLIPVSEILKKPISPSIKKLIINGKIGLNYKGVDLQRDILTVSNILSQIHDIDG